MKTILATYSTPENANLALEGLTAAGVEKSDIGVMTLDKEHAARMPASSEVGKVSDDAATGAWQGAKLGLVGGLLVGVAALTIPGLGPLLAVGPLASALGVTGVAGTAVTGAGIGTALGGIGALVGSFVKLGVNEAEAKKLGDDVEGGGVLLSVKDSGGLDVLGALQKGSPTRVSSVA